MQEDSLETSTLELHFTFNTLISDLVLNIFFETSLEWTEISETSNQSEVTSWEFLERYFNFFTSLHFKSVPASDSLQTFTPLHFKSEIELIHFNSSLNNNINNFTSVRSTCILFNSNIHFTSLQFEVPSKRCESWYGRTPGIRIQVGSFRRL